VLEHAPGADRGKLVVISDRDQAPAAFVHGGHEGSETGGVAHPGLIDIHGGVLVDVQAAGVDRGREAIDRARAALQGRGGFAEALRGAPGDGDAVDLAVGFALGLGGGVDDDALAGAGRADQHGGAATTPTTTTTCTRPRARGSVVYAQQSSPHEPPSRPTGVAQQSSPAQAARPSRTATAATASAVTGSAHHQPSSALAPSPTSSATDR
jgi:hypothetical protein